MSKEFYLPVVAFFSLVFWGGLQAQFGWTIVNESTIRTSIYLLSYLAFFLLVFSGIRDISTVPTFYRLIGLTVTVYCSYGLFIYFTGNDKILWYDKWVSRQELTSTFVNKNSFAAYVGIGLNCTIAYSFWLFDVSTKNFVGLKTKLFGFLDRHPQQALVLSLSFTIVSTALMLTASRAGIISTVISIIYLTASLAFRDMGKPKPMIKTKSFNWAQPAFLISFFAIFLFSGDMFGHRMNESFDGAYRFKVYSALIDHVLEGPLVGTGLGTFPEVFAQLRTSDHEMRLLRAHNDYLEVLLTAGPILGGIFIFLLSVFAAKFAIKRYDSHTVGIFSTCFFSIILQMAFHSAVDFPLQIPAIAITVCGIMGATAVLWCDQR